MRGRRGAMIMIWLLAAKTRSQSEKTTRVGLGERIVREAVGEFFTLSLAIVLSRASLSRMLDYDSFHEKDDVLRNVGSQVGDPFEVFRDEKKGHGVTDPTGILHHESDQNPEDRVVELVHPYICGADGAGQLGIPAYEGVECLRKHLPGVTGHLQDLRDPSGRRKPREEGNGACDVRGMVPNAFEVIGDFHRHRDKSEIASEGLLESEQLVSSLVDLELQRVDFSVAVDHGVGSVDIPRCQRLDREAELLLCDSRHLEELRLELSQLGVKVPGTSMFEGHPNLPVI
jgi:hypothetical protein